MVLLLVLVSLALLTALIAPLALLSGTVALDSNHRGNTLRHRLAVDSLVAILPDLLEADDRIARDLDRCNQARVSLELGDLHVEALLQDDTAKLPTAMLIEHGGVEALGTALTELAAQLPLPPAALRTSAHGPSWTGCLDDLFSEPTDHDLYGTPDSAYAWTRYVTPIGQAIHAYRADAAVLEAALVDLQPGLGTELARQRQTQTKSDLSELLDMIELPEAIADEVRHRLTSQTRRYSLLVRTRRGADVRQRYLLCTAATNPQVLLDWEVAR